MYNDTRHKLKMTREQFKQYLLDNYLDENNRKISERKLVSTHKFMNDTGLYKLDKITGIKTPVSMGTMAYWKKVLNLRDFDIYKYHRDVTKRITEDYENWRAINIIKNHNTKRKTGVLKGLVVYTPELEKEKLLKECSFPKHFVNYKLERLRKLAFELWEDLGLNPNEELSRLQKEIMGSELGKERIRKSKEKKSTKKKKKGGI